MNSYKPRLTFRSPIVVHDGYLFCEVNEETLLLMKTVTYPPSPTVSEAEAILCTGGVIIVSVLKEYTPFNQWAIHKVVNLNCVPWPVALCMPIKQVERNRTFLRKQRGERRTVIACCVRKFCLVRVAH